MELAQRATTLRRIAEEGLLYDEVLRKKQQNAWKSWAMYVGGAVVISLSVISSMYLTHDTLRTTLINTYARSEKTQDVITSSFFSLSSLGLIPQPIDQPFLPEPIALKTLELQEAYSKTSTAQANTTGLQVELQRLEILQAAVQQMLSTASQAAKLAGQHFSLHSIHTLLPPIAAAASANASALYKKCCTISFGWMPCMQKTLDYQEALNVSLALESQAQRLNTTEGTLEVLYERGSLTAYPQLIANKVWVENWYHQNLTNEIPYDTLSIAYLESIHTFMKRAMNGHIIGTELDTLMTREAQLYLTSQLFQQYLILIKTLITMNVDGKRLILDSYQHIHDQDARNSQYTRAKAQVDSDLATCEHQTTLLCQMLREKSEQVITWVHNIERFQLPLPANFLKDAYQALLTTEITTIITIRDFRRFQRIHEFKKNPSAAFLILTSAIGIAAFIVAKLLLFDLPYTYVRLLILPAEYMTERIQYSIDTLREKRGMLTGSQSLHLLDAVTSAENIRTTPKAEAAPLNRIENVPSSAAKPERKSLRNQNRAERRLQDADRSTEGDSHGGES
jgi:hypothetical protein